MAKAAFFWNMMAKRYAKMPVADQQSYEKKLDITAGLLNPGMDVFEFGCGTGSTALALAPHARHILATDVAAKMIAIARDKAKAANIENVTFEAAIMDDIKAADGSYDMVLGHNILHLMDNWQDVIVSVHRMLKPGGVFISTTACLEGRFGWFRPILAFLGLIGLLPKVKFFTEDALVGALTGAGFTIEQKWLPTPNAALFVVAKKA